MRTKSVAVLQQVENNKKREAQPTEKTKEQGRDGTRDTNLLHGERYGQASARDGYTEATRAKKQSRRYPMNSGTGTEHVRSEDFLPRALLRSFQTVGCAEYVTA